MPPDNPRTPLPAKSTLTAPTLTHPHTRSTQSQILIVEDDCDTRRLLADSLDAASYIPLLAGRGSEALQLFRAHEPDLILLDLMLPDIDGLAVCRAIRAESAVPILVVSALDDEERQVALFEAGADDYLVKPTRRYELLARMRRALRRSASISPDMPQSYQIGQLRIDIMRHDVWCAEVLVHLSPVEWLLLLELLRVARQVATYTELCARLWPGQTRRDAESLQSVVKRLRQKLGSVVEVINVRGVGYRLDEAGSST